MKDDRLRINTAAGMRALAHPARLASLRRLMRSGPATATELGELAGLTASAMSYHLRALERAGLIETAPGRGDGRERLWQSAYDVQGFEAVSPDDGSDDTRLASVELLEAAITIDEVETRRWLGSSDEPGWVDYGVLMTTNVVLSQAELVEVSEALTKLIEPYTRNHREGSVPADAVTMRATFKCFPSGESE